MLDLNLTTLCTTLKGALFNNASTILRGVSIDSRENSLEGKIFFALKGPRFDGHDFIKQAIDKKASAIILQKENTLRQKTSTPIIKVDDTLKALHKLAHYWRKKVNFSVIGVTGSVGKTTTVHFCKTLLEAFFSVKASQKSFNNQYGVPLTLLSADKHTDIVVQEIGMNQKGEIKKLCKLAKPNIVTVTTVGSAHIENLGDKTAIANEKEQIYIQSPQAIKVFNLDSPHTKKMYERARQKKYSARSLCFSSQDKKADVFLQIKEARSQELLVSGHLQGEQNQALVPIAGKSHLTNIMVATALALSTGLTPKQIWSRLAFFKLPAGRNQWLKLSGGAEVLFDAYNASPESLIGFLDYFLSPLIKGDKILILGDFMEQGKFLKELQYKIAEKLLKNPVSFIWLIGDQARAMAQILKKTKCVIPCHANQTFNKDTAQKIASKLNPGTSLGCKASRKSELEEVLKYFTPLTKSF